MSDSDSIVYVNVEEGINRVMKNTSLFVRLLTKFKSDTNINELETAFSRGEIDKVKNAAHTIKGLSANLSFIELYKQVVKLEAQTKEGVLNNDQLAEVRKTYDITLTEIDKVINQYA